MFINNVRLIITRLSMSTYANYANTSMYDITLFMCMYKNVAGKTPRSIEAALVWRPDRAELMWILFY